MFKKSCVRVDLFLCTRPEFKWAGLRVIVSGPIAVPAVLIRFNVSNDDISRCDTCLKKGSLRRFTLFHRGILTAPALYICSLYLFLRYRVISVI